MATQGYMSSEQVLLEVWVARLSSWRATAPSAIRDVLTLIDLIRTENARRRIVGSLETDLGTLQSNSNQETATTHIGATTRGELRGRRVQHASWCVVPT